MKYTIDEYAAEFFGGSIKDMAAYWDSLGQRVPEWRKAGVFFIVEEGCHWRCSIRGKREGLK